MTTFITGGAGFIGRYFCERLMAAGQPFVVFDLVKPEFDIGSNKSVVGDVRDEKAVRAAIGGCSRVLHLAAAHHDFGINHDTYFDVNENGSRILSDEMDAAGISELCFFSSVAVYGEAPEPHFEDSPKNPKHPYGASKLAGERVLGEWVRRGGARRCLVIRPTITFGPRNFANMYSLIRQIESGKFARVGKGENVKSLSYVENIVGAALYLWSKPDRPSWDIYNYIEKPDLTSAQIAGQIYTSLSKKPWPFTVPLGLALFMALPFDIVIKLTGKNLPVSGMRIKKLFSSQTKFEADKLLKAGWVSPVKLTEGLDRMTKWYLTEGKFKPAVWRTPPEKVGGALKFAKMGGEAQGPQA